MPSLPERKISQDPQASNLLATDRLVGLRTPQNEPDPALQNFTMALPVLAAGLMDPLRDLGLALSEPMDYATLTALVADEQLKEGQSIRLTGRGDGYDIITRAVTPALLSPTAFAFNTTTADFLAVLYDQGADTWMPLPAIAAVYTGDPANNNVLIGNGASNSIGAGCTNCRVAGVGNTIVAGHYNAIDGTEANEIQGGSYNTIGGSKSCVIPATCDFVMLLNCAGFTVPASTTNTTYINNVAV